MEEKPGRGHLLLDLFTQMLLISAFTFGGGFVIVSLMQKRFVEERHYLTEREMLDLAALSQSCPGAIAVNAAILLGWRVAGAAGMAVCVLGAILPPLVLISALSFMYEAFCTNRYVALFLRGTQAGVAAVVLDVALSLGWKVLKGGRPLHIALMAAAFVLAAFTDVNVVVLLCSSALIGVVASLCRRQARGREHKA